VVGQENLRGMKSEAVIFAANHTHPLDGIITAVAIAMPWNGFRVGEFLPVRYLAFEDYFRWVRFCWPFPFPISILTALWFRLSACISVRSRRKDEIDKISLEGILINAIEALNKNQKVFIFPEGKMSEDGNLQRGKKGVACLQKKTSALIVPMGITNSYKMFSFKNICASLMRKRKLVIKIGEPIKLFNPNPNRTLEDAADMVMEKISELL
jgi:1-acyl-sn-glycerol-3-phosphate acyltransferase